MKNRMDKKMENEMKAGSRQNLLVRNEETTEGSMEATQRACTYYNPMTGRYVEFHIQTLYTPI